MTTLTVTRNARIPDPAILMRQRNMLWNKIILKDKKRVSNNNYPPPLSKGQALQREICNAFEIPETWIFKKSRKREIVNARQVYIYLIRKATIINEDPKQKERRKSPTALARYIGWHHATIYYSEDMAQNYYDTEENIRQLIDRLLKELLIGKITLPEI